MIGQLSIGAKLTQGDPVGIQSGLAAPPGTNRATDDVPISETQFADVNRRARHSLVSLNRTLMLQAGRGIQALLAPTAKGLTWCAQNEHPIMMEVADRLLGTPWELFPVGDRVLSEMGPTGRSISAPQRQYDTGGSFLHVQAQLHQLPVRVLLVVDRTLDFARAEAAALWQYFGDASRFQRSFLADPTPDALFERLNSFKPQILHYAGHGHVDLRSPAASGWCLRSGVLNSESVQFSGVERWPAVVFANACAHTPELPLTMSTGNSVDSLAEALMRHGTQHYVSTLTWIDDGEFALKFAQAVYDGIFEGLNMGEVVYRARRWYLPVGKRSERPCPVPSSPGEEKQSVQAAHYVLYGDIEQVLYAPPDEEHQVVVRCGRYELEGEVAATAYSREFKAQGDDGSAAVAILYEPQRLLGANSKREAADVAERLGARLTLLRNQLDGPMRPYGVQRILDVEVHELCVCIVFEAATGPSFAYNEARSQRETLALILQLADTLQAAHDAGLVHGKLAPSQLYLEQGRVRVSRLGLCQALRDAGLGLLPDSQSEPYRSSEYYEARADRLDASVDLWALSVLAFQLLTGQHPLKGAMQREENWKEAITRGRVERPSELVTGFPDELEDVLLRALSRSKQERYSGVREFAAALTRAWEGRAVVGGFTPSLDAALDTAENLFCIYVHDEQVVAQRLKSLAASKGLGLVFWSATSGLSSDVVQPEASHLQFQLDPIGPVQWLQRQRKPTMLVMLGADTFLDERQLSTGRRHPYREVSAAGLADRLSSVDGMVSDYDEFTDSYTVSLAFPKAELLREIWDFSLRQKTLRHGHKLVVTSSAFSLPDELAKAFQVFACDTARIGEVEQLLTARSISDEPWALDFAWHAAGLTHSQIEQVLDLAHARHSILDERCAQDLLRQKELEVRRTGVLEWWTPRVTLTRDVVGAEGLKAWCAMHLASYCVSWGAGVPVPRGIVLGGPPGTGKSFCAQALAGELEWPLLRLDLGRVFTSRVGQAESNLVHALECAERVSPSILWVDDIDTSLGGAEHGAGVVGRVLNLFLTWMQERVNPVFVVVTMRDPDAVPIELTRLGRFDKQFFFDLPVARERALILAKALERHERSTQGYDFGGLGQIGNQLSCADLVGAVEAALFVAAAHGRATPTESELRCALQGVLKDTRTGSLAAFADQRLRWLGVASPVSLPLSVAVTTPV